MRLSTKKRGKGSVRLAYKNGLTNALIGIMLLCRKLNGARSKFDKIDMNPNNVSKTEMLSHVRHYFGASVCPVMKRVDKCGTNVWA